jgi:hypothetical protein
LAVRAEWPEGMAPGHDFSYPHKGTKELILLSLASKINFDDGRRSINRDGNQL